VLTCAGCILFAASSSFFSGRHCVRRDEIPPFVREHFPRQASENIVPSVGMKLPRSRSDVGARRTPAASFSPRGGTFDVIEEYERTFLAKVNGSVEIS